MFITKVPLPKGAPWGPGNLWSPLDKPLVDRYKFGSGNE